MAYMLSSRHDSSSPVRLTLTDAYERFELDAVGQILAVCRSGIPGHRIR